MEFSLSSIWSMVITPHFFYQLACLVIGKQLLHRFFQLVIISCRGLIHSPLQGISLGGLQESQKLPPGIAVGKAQGLLDIKITKTLLFFSPLDCLPSIFLL